MEVITRKEAVKRGLSWFFNGKACPKGHIAKRDVAKSSCFACKVEDTAKRRAQRLAEDPIGEIQRRSEASRKGRVGRVEYFREKSRKYYSNNREKCIQAARTWAIAHPERIAASNLKWRQANPEKVRLLNHCKRAMRRAAKGRLSNGLVEKLFVMQQGKCPCCGESLGTNFHLDHIVPLSRGGSNSDDNVQLLRRTCNQQKHAKDPIEFMQSRGFLI